MNKMTDIDAVALIRLKACSHVLTHRQYKMLREQVLAGDPEGALRELEILITSKNND